MAKLIIAAFAAALWGAVAAAQSAGTYRGLGEAEGMTLEIESVRGGWKGAIVEADGRRLPFEASGGEVAEGRITGGDVTLYLRLRTHPMGVEAVIVPVDGQGTLYADRARALAFLRPGVEMPDASGTSPPPERAGQKVSARAFVASFAFWSPIEVAWGFDGIEPRFRTTIRLFPVVLADMLWKMCRSPERTPGLAEALRGQGVSCQDVSAAFLRLQAGDGFDRFKRAVAEERAILLTVIDCADDLTRTQRDCAKASAETGRRALSMETVASVLSRYR